MLGGLVAASPASAARSCTNWQDGMTFGISCSQYDSAQYVQAVARCTNGETVWGSWAKIGDGSWSYAYCSSWPGASLGEGWFNIK
ncbi:hypothetical protein [Kitasatospora griseola]|uniref:hypothetical protein n=1 Tax=Kitasatospora griseola TaxID=2064 RepID=UPI00382F6A99